MVTVKKIIQNSMTRITRSVRSGRDSTEKVVRKVFFEKLAKAPWHEELRECS